MRMHSFKPTVWLMACVLITCYFRQATQCLPAPASAINNNNIRGSGSLGIAFPANEGPFLTVERYEKAIGPRSRVEEQEHHQAHQQQDRHTKAADEDEHWQSKRLRLEEPESEGTINSGLNQLTAKESMRRFRIDQLLEALSGSIPSAATPARTRSSLQSSRLTGGDQQQAPIYRSGRMFPMVGADQLRGPLTHRDQLSHLSEFARSPIEPRNRWQTSAGIGNSMLDGRTGLRGINSGQYGIVWPANPSGGGGVQSKPHSTLAVTNKIPRSYAIDDLGQQINELADIYRPNQIGRLYQESASSRKSHRSGSEEFAIQTPVHSQSGGDYETKRVENSRGWNTLRGMWGKRSAYTAEDNRRLMVPGSRLARSNDDSGSDADWAAANDDNEVREQTIRSI